MRFWIKSEHREHLVSKQLRKNSDEPTLTIDGKYLTGTTKTHDEFRARYSIRHHTVPFVLGKITPWDEIRDHRCLKVEIEPSDLLPRGAVFTKTSWIHIRLEEGRRTLDQIRNTERFEFVLGSNFIESAFRTFDFAHSNRAKTGYTPRLLLYDPYDNIDEQGNISKIGQYTYEDLKKVLDRRKNGFYNPETIKERIH